MTTLKASDILQINATVIAGVLILLTISAGSQPKVDWQLWKGGLLTWLILFPFAVSSIFILLSELTKRDVTGINEKYDENMRWSLRWMMGGFGYIIVFLGIYVIKLNF